MAARVLAACSIVIILGTVDTTPCVCARGMPGALWQNLCGPRHSFATDTCPMLTEIALFLLDTVFTLFGMALLLRLWMQWARVPTRNPVSQGVFQVTDWLVRPLRRVIPGLGGIDWATVIGAWLTAVVFLLLVMAFQGADLLGVLPMVLLAGVIYTIKWGVSLVMWVVLLMAVLSWVNPHSPVMPALQHLTLPFLRPIQRVMPRLGGFDLSPLVLFVILQVILMVLARLTLIVMGLRLAF
jgi:YggT family protein